MQSCNNSKMDTQALVTSIDDIVTTMDDDSTRFAEMILNKARFHRILVESLERGIKKDKKEEKRRKSKSGKKKKSDKKRRKSSKKDKEKKEKKKKESDENTREKVIEKLKKKGYEQDEKRIEKAIRKINRQKRKLKKEKEEKKKTSSKKKKKTSSSKKKKKRDSKLSKASTTIDISENDSSDENFNYWWSIGNQNYKSTPTRIVNKLPHSSPKKKKKAKRSSKTGIDSTDHSNATESATEKTEHSSRCSLASSQQWSFSSPIVRKLTEESTEETNEQRVVMWWDKVQDAPPKLPNMMPIRTPATTPTMAPRRSVIPMLLSPRSDTSDSDYDDVSIFSEESLSEQILDDLSCILDCSDESDTDYPETPKPRKASLRSLSNKSYDSSSICSGPFTLISPLRKKTSFKECYGEEIITPTSERHLASVKILGSRPSPYSSPGSQASSDHSNSSSRKSISPTTTSQTGSPTTEESSPAPEELETPVALETPLDGIAPASNGSVFGSRKVETSPRIPALPTNVPLT